MYMVAPFMGALKRWIAQQRRAAVVDSELEHELPVPEMQTAQYQYDDRDQPAYGTDALGMSSQGANGNEHIANEVSYNASIPVQQTSATMDPAAKLKALLSIKPSISSPISPNPGSQEATLLAMLRRAPPPEVPKPSSSAIESFTLGDSLSGQ